MDDKMLSAIADWRGDVHIGSSNNEAAELSAYRALGTIDALTRLQRDYSDLRNELCLACGKYKEAHLGLCNNCRWYDSVDVNKMDCAAAAMEKGEGE